MELTIFDQILYQFETIATGGVPQVRALVMSTFWILATIDACMAFLTNLEDGDHFKILIQKCLKIGFWLFFVNSWGLFCNVIKNSLIMAGSVIGSGASMSLMQHPSEIVSQGILTLDPILEYESKFTGITDVMANFGMLMACIISYLFGCLAYVLLGIQVVLTYVEFYLMCALFTVFVPFGVTKWTSFLAEKAIGGVIAYGVKLMVLSCIVSIIPDTLNAYGNGFTLTPENALTAMISLVAVGVLLAFLSWAAPALAASMMTGGPSLTAGSVAMAGAAVAAGTAIAAGGAAKAAGAVMGSGKGAAGSGGGNTSAAVNAMSRGQLPPGSSSSGGSGGGASGGSDSGDATSSPTFSGGGAQSYGGGAGAATGNSGSSGGGQVGSPSSDGAAGGSGGGAAGTSAGNGSQGGSAANSLTKAAGGAAGSVAGSKAGAAIGGAAAGPAGAAVGGVAGSVAGDAAGETAVDGAASGIASGSSSAPAVSGGGMTGGGPSGGSNDGAQNSGGGTGNVAGGSGSWNRTYSGGNASGGENAQNAKQQQQPRFSNIAKDAMLIKNMTPQEPGPHGSMHAPIRD